MSNVLQSPPNAPTTQNPEDFTTLISALNALAQALHGYRQTCKINMPEQSKQNLDAVTVPNPSKLEKRKELYQTFSFDPADTTAFAKKEIAQSFEKSYNCGTFRGEIRYYYVPANVVRFEYKLLHKHR